MTPVRRAPWPVGLAYGIGLALLITLVGPLALFNPWFVSALQARHGVAAAFDQPQPEVDRVTREMLVDLVLDGDFDAGFADRAPLLDQRERSHMHDVSVLVRLLLLVVSLAAITVAVCGRLMRDDVRAKGRIMLLSAGIIGSAAVLLALAFAFAFETAFLAFHAIFFPPDSFLFPPGSNLIVLFPEPFWFDASLAAGATILLAAAFVAWLGWRRTTSPVAGI